MVGIIILKLVGKFVPKLAGLLVPKIGCIFALKLLGIFVAHGKCNQGGHIGGILVAYW